MEYARLGSTGLKVSRMCLGCMGFGDAERWVHKWVLSEENSRPIIKKALEMGINFFDTANVYSIGTSEEYLGHALKDFTKRDDVIIATKVFSKMREGPNGSGLSRKAILSEIDNSLKRLGTDYVDLYQVHRWDYETPIEETLEALHDVVKAGKARYIGASSMFAWQFQKALDVAEKHGWTRFISMQNHLNLIYREEEREMLPLCREEKIGVIPWSPLASGRLTRDWSSESTLRSETDQIQKMKYDASTESDRPIVERVAELAQTHGVSRTQIALAWLLQKESVTAPIIGATKIPHLEEAIGALSVKLTPEEITYLEEPYVPHRIVGHQWFSEQVMEYIRLGSTGLKVSRVCLGCMSYGVPGEGNHWVLNEELSRPYIKRALEAGINFFDTADVYSKGSSEQILGGALKDFAKRDEVVIATKVRQPMGPGPNDYGLSRKHILSSIDASLKRLGTDYVDLYQIHRWDYETPIEETMEALHEIVRAGKALYIGASAMFAWQFAKAQYTAALHGWTRFVSMQNHYNLIYREDERELLPLCQDLGIGVIPFSPLARGVLARKAVKGQEETIRYQSDSLAKSRYAQEDNLTTVERVSEVAEARAIPMAQVAVAWMYSKPIVNLPIIGATKPHHLDDAIAALSVRLTAEEITRLEEPYRPHPVIAHS